MTEWRVAAVTFASSMKGASGEGCPSPDRRKGSTQRREQPPTESRDIPRHPRVVHRLVRAKIALRYKWGSKCAPVIAGLRWREVVLHKRPATFASMSLWRSSVMHGKTAGRR